MRVTSLLVALVAFTFVGAAPVARPEADAAINADWKRLPPDWKREADAEAEAEPAPAWKREAEPEADAAFGRTPSWKREPWRTPTWKREPYRSPSWKRDADASQEKRGPRWGNIYTW